MINFILNKNSKGNEYLGTLMMLYFSLIFKRDFSLGGKKIGENI